MTPADVVHAVAAAINAAVDAGALPAQVRQVADVDITVERPKNREHGDYATNAAMRLAKLAARPPREVAEAIALHLRVQPGIESVEITAMALRKNPRFISRSVGFTIAGGLGRTIVAILFQS